MRKILPCGRSLVPPHFSGRMAARKIVLTTEKKEMERYAEKISYQRSIILVLADLEFNRDIFCVMQANQVRTNAPSIGEKTGYGLK